MLTIRDRATRLIVFLVIGLCGLLAAMPQAVVAQQRNRIPANRSGAQASPPPARAPARGTGLRLLSKPDYEKQDKRLLAFSAGDGLPEQVDLSADLPPPGDQGTQGSCTGWAVGYGLKSYLAKVKHKWDLTSGEGVNYGRVFSPAYVYSGAKTADGGATLAAALTLVRDRGVATWAEFPYDPTIEPQSPGESLQQTAARWRIKSWQRLDVSVIDIKRQIAQRRPVVIGAEISKDFRQGKLADGALWKKRGVPIEAHAMLLVGYDDSRKAFKLMNSWGPGWGEGGFAWLAYKLVPKVVREAYVATDEDGPAEAPAANAASASRKSTPVLVGFNIRSGDVLDGITPIFREQTFENGSLAWSAGTRLGDTIGGHGGGSATILRDGAYVVALRIKEGNYFGARHVVSFQADLRDAATGQIHTSEWYGSGAYATNVSGPIEYKARNGAFISDLEGSSSDHSSGETFVSEVNIVETALDWYE